MTSARDLFIISNSNCYLSPYTWPRFEPGSYLATKTYLSLSSANKGLKNQQLIFTICLREINSNSW